MPEPTTITDAAGFIRRGELTPVELLEQCLSRIDRYEDRVKAWVYLDREGAREQAERLTAELRAGQDRGPLHGIPIGIKDIIDVFDMPTGCGSKLWANSYARQDATVVERLRQAGAIIMGKTVTTAYASFDPSMTRNPWNLDHTPGGSSSGSAAAVACGMCLGALASQTGGSITRPASYCGVYSIKPTYGRVSLNGVMPLAPSMDHVGAMANRVRDLAILLQPLVQPHTHDFPPIPHLLREITRVRGDEGPKGLVSLPDLLPGRATPVMARAFERLQETTTCAGWTWSDEALPSAFGEVLHHHHNVMAVEAAAYHGQRMRRHPEDYPPKIASLIRHGQSVTAPEFSATVLHMHSLRDSIRALFATADHVYCIPATGGPAPTAETTGDPAFNSPWSYTGLPTVSLPFSWSEARLPLAVQLVGAPGGEANLLAVAARLEAAIDFERRVLPL